MNISEYQKQAREFAIYPDQWMILYPTLGLAGESGEVADKVKKVYRDKGGLFDYEQQAEIAKELGDVLWYVANLASDLGLDLGEIAEMNINKLASRKTRGVLGGSGDNR